MIISSKVKTKDTENFIEEFHKVYIPIANECAML